MGTAMALMGCAACAVLAQDVELRSETRSGGSWTDCAPGIAVDFEELVVGDLNYLFVPEVTLGDNEAMGPWTWSYFDGEPGQYFGSVFAHEFPTAGEHGVCLTVAALHGETYEPCTATICKLIDVVPDTSCLNLVPDFTIAAVNGQEVTFQSTTAFYAPVDLVWDQDGLQTIGGETPSFTFAGVGPHRICLTAIGPPPVNCVRTVCKWLYMGPGNVPCEALMTQGFLHATYDDRFVFMLDTSRTSGMDHEISWELGDGNIAEGRFAAHAYANYGQYQLCGTVKAWGPLVADTCVTTQCVWLDLAIAATVDEAQPASAALRLWPNPSSGRFRIEGLAEGAALLRLVDALGREVWHRTAMGQGSLEVDPGPLAPGTYLLHVEQGSIHGTLRIMRE